MIEGHLIDKVLFFISSKRFFFGGEGDLSPAPACDGSVTNGVGEETKDISEQYGITGCGVFKGGIQN